MKAHSFFCQLKVAASMVALGSFLVLLATCSSSDENPGLVISSLSPASGPKGTIVTVTGSGFSPNAVDNVATLNSIACTVISASSNELKITIPPKVGSGKLTISVKGKTGETPLFTYVKSTDEIGPEISSISPLSGPFNTVVTINGSGFSAKAIDNIVTLNGNTCTVTSASATELKIIIPSKAGSGRINVKTNNLTGETPAYTYVYSVFLKTVFAGSTPADFDKPIGVAVDRDDNVYVADFGSRSIKKISPSGTLSTLTGADQFTSLHGIAVDSKGNLYVSDRGDSKIKKVTAAGVVTIFAGNTPGEFNSPLGVAIDGEDNVYVADYGNNKVSKITPTGTVSQFTDFPSATSIAIDGDGNIYVGGLHHIQKFAGGVGSAFAGSTQGSGDKFDNIRFLAADKNGTVYASDYGNLKIKKITSSGIATAIADVFNPWGIAVDKKDNVYVAVSVEGVIYKIAQY